MFNINNAPDSPEGDVTFPADFTVDGQTAAITLTNQIDFGTQITVIKRTGTQWDGNKNGTKVDPVNAPSVGVLNDTSTVGQFLRAVPGIWYSEYKQISTTPTGTFDSAGDTMDSSGQTFDQG